MTKQRINILGAGGLGREVRVMLNAISGWEFGGYFDDGIKAGMKVDGGEVLGSIQALVDDRSSRAVVLAIGDPKIKLDVARRFQRTAHIQFPPIVHPGAVVMDPKNTKIGDGCLIMAGCILTTGIVLEPFTMLNLGVTVGHDARIGRGTSVMPGVNVAGNVSIGEGVLVGSGANIVNKVSIGDFARIGSGAVVIGNISAGATAVGVPAREISSA